MKNKKESKGAEPSETLKPAILITDDPKLVAELHDRGEKEIAVRDGREYVFRVRAEKE